jgi:hypothetical protein
MRRVIGGSVIYDGDEGGELCAGGWAMHLIFPSRDRDWVGRKKEGVGVILGFAVSLEVHLGHIFGAGFGSSQVVFPLFCFFFCPAVTLF